MSARLIATRIINDVLNGHSLNVCFEQYKINQFDDKALIQELCYGTCRFYYSLSKISALLLDKPVKKKDAILNVIIQLGLYQLIHTNIPQHVAINETVNLCKAFKKTSAKGLVNASLREFQRNQAQCLQKLADDEEYLYSTPNWLIEQTQQAWPQQWQTVLNNNNTKPPLTLRINQQKTTTTEYCQLLQKNKLSYIEHANINSAITLQHPMPSDKIPGFKQGLVSIQTLAAQLAAPLLELKPAMRVLDACAAPGGKSCHLLEAQADIHLTAIDQDQQRLNIVKQQLKRLHLSAKMICANAEKTKDWWDNNLFDRILLDVPCSSTGVIRRHPDIKLLRKVTDIAQYQQTQLMLLTALWPLLKADGLLLYATCSIIPTENNHVIKLFLQQTDDAKEVLIKADWGLSQTHGRQILPEQDWDGFYYCLLKKTG